MFNLSSDNSGIFSRVQCPNCAKQGNDKTQDNLIQFRNGTSHCFACNYHEDEGKAYSKKGSNQQNYAQLPLEILEPALTKRGIKLSVAKSYDTKLGVNKDSGQIVITFPLFNQMLVKRAAHYRAVDVATQQLEHDKWWFKKLDSTYLPVFGSHLLTDKIERVIVVEGETDCLSLASTNEDSKTLVVGIVGATNAKKAANWLSGKKFKERVVIAFDNDAAGQKATEDFLQIYEGADVYVVPNGCKDVNDAVTQQGLTAAQLIENAGKTSRLATVADSLLSEAFEFKKRLTNKFISFDFFGTLSDKVSFAPGHLIGLVGESGKGKSTLTEHITEEIVRKGHKCLFYSAEMLPHEVIFKMTRQCGYEDEADARKGWGKSLHNLFFVNTTLDYSGSAQDRIVSCLHEVNSIGEDDVKFLIVDHLGAVTNGLDARDMELFVKDLKALAQKNNLCVLLLTHTSKNVSAGNKNKVYRPKLSDVYGTGGFAKYCDAVIGVSCDHRQKETYVESLKIDRFLAEGYFDSTLSFNNFRLSEDAAGDYDEQLEDTDDEDDQYKDLL